VHSIRQTRWPLVASFILGALKFNMSGRTKIPGLPYPLAKGETLVDAICCDSAFKRSAEPVGYYARPDVNLFAELGPGNITTFYDSVCGVPVFAAPQNRSLADFEADTNEHGWPSFRTAEVITANVIVDGADVKSSCGTHLGSFLPDEKGARWCIDLSCISGHVQH
jgi:hypothetical protein